MTNDYWSVSSIAMKQHLVFSIFRAIEVRKPLLRISNGGYSGYVDELGKFYSKIPIFSQGMMTANLRLTEDRDPTIYIRYGEWFPAACLFLIIFYAVVYLQQFLKEFRKKLNIHVNPE